MRYELWMLCIWRSRRAFIADGWPPGQNHGRRGKSSRSGRHAFLLSPGRLVPNATVVALIVNPAAISESGAQELQADDLHLLEQMMEGAADFEFFLAALQMHD